MQKNVGTNAEIEDPRTTQRNKDWKRASTESAQEQYRYSSGNLAKFQPAYNSAIWFYAASLLGHRSKVDERSQETLKKPQSKENGPFKITSGHFLTITLGKNGIEDILYIDKLALVKCKDNIIELILTAEHHSVEWAVSLKDHQTARPEKTEIVVDLIIGLNVKQTDWWYTVRWYWVWIGGR